MAYTPRTWKIGEEITSEKLNHIEDGIANAGGSSTLVVTATGNADGLTMDHTWQEIHDAFPNVEFLENRLKITRGLITSVGDSDGYTVNTVTFGDMRTSSKTYSADSATGYPAASGGSPSIV